MKEAKSWSLRAYLDSDIGVSDPPRPGLRAREKPVSQSIGIAGQLVVNSSASLGDF